MLTENIRKIPQAVLLAIIAHVVLADLSANREACTLVEARQDGVQGFPSDIVKIDVDTVRTVRIKRGADFRLLVVERVVEAGVFDSE